MCFLCFFFNFCLFILPNTLSSLLSNFFFMMQDIFTLSVGLFIHLLLISLFLPFYNTHCKLLYVVLKKLFFSSCMTFLFAFPYLQRYVLFLTFRYIPFCSYCIIFVIILFFFYTIMYTLCTTALYSVSFSRLYFSVG